MRILHYINQRRDHDLLSDYFSRLTDELDESKNIAVYSITRSDDYQQALDEHNPDIVHIHGCWDRYAYQLMKATMKQGAAVVISPHWEIGTYAMRHEQPLAKMIKLYDFQKWMITHAEAIIVTSQSESDDIERLKWQNKIGTVESSVLDSSVSDEAMAADMIDIYQKVIDTRYRVLMGDEEKEAIRSLIYVGMSHDEKQSLLSSNRLLSIRSLKPLQWRHILLYGDDEDIRSIIDTAADKLQLDIPSIETENISRYPVEHPKSMGPLEGSRVIGRQKHTAKKLHEETEDDTPDLQRLSTMLVNAKYLLGKHQLSMRQLAELYSEIKYSDFDERRFLEITKDLKLRRLSRRLQQIMSEEMFLDEGFMTDKPLNDRITRRLHNDILRGH